MGDEQLEQRQEEAVAATEGAPPLHEFGQVLARATAKGHDLGSLTLPLLEALAKLAELETTYLTTFDWERREQTVRFVYSAVDLQVEQGMTLPLPEALAPEALPGITRSPEAIPRQSPDSQVAKQLGLKTYISVPITAAKHRLYGMICGASRLVRPVSESVISVMEFFAQIIADHVARTETAAMEERALSAEGRLRSRAMFLAEAEHQLKTPLTAILGTSSTLNEQWATMPDELRLELLSAVARNARELSIRVDDLLVEARADIQARELTTIRLLLAPLVVAITRAFDGISAGHRVVSEVAEGTVVIADPTPLYQVLGHLLDNAIKYMPGGGTIRLRAVPTRDDVRVEIIDEGMGLPDGVDIFEPFRRGDTGQPGVGLGLHIVRTLVEAMGGSISARSNSDRGSTFTVRLPKG